MTYERKIAHLEEAHAMLERELSNAMMTNSNQTIINDIKKKKLHAKDLIEDLKRLDASGKDFK